MKKILVYIMLIISIIAIPTNVFADEGPKPSIDVKIKNLKTSKYVIDLFVYNTDEKVYKSKSSYNGGGLSDKQVKKLHELNLNNWISASTRWNNYLMFSDCLGNKDFTNSFGYFGTPTKYKIVIINEDTGEIKVSDKIVRKDFNSVVTIDYNTMKVVSGNNIIKTLIVTVLALILTITIELVIAVLFKTKYYNTIAITNLISNILLQVLLLIFTNNYLLVFIIGEILVIGAELLVYLLRFKNISKVKTTIYTLVANIVTILISLILYMI